jgi:hypothetical protein
VIEVCGWAVITVDVEAMECRGLVHRESRQGSSNRVSISVDSIGNSVGAKKSSTFRNDKHADRRLEDCNDVSRWR